MSIPNDPNTPDGTGGEPRIRHVRVTLTMNDASNDTSDAQIASAVEGLLDAAIDGRAPDPSLDQARSRIASWTVSDQGRVPAGWAAFEDSGIPEMVAEMFPPEPRREDYRTPGGGIDDEEFVSAQDDWRSECLRLAVAASQLPEVLDRLERAEGVQDRIADVHARNPLPVRPRRQDFPEQFFGTRPFDATAYARAHERWQQEMRQTATARDAAIERILTESESHGRYLPAQFQQEWIPKDLLAVSTLRALLDADPATTSHLIDRDTRQQLEAMLYSGDPYVRIIDPDHPDGPELYEGQASEAHRWIPAGVFAATQAEGAGEFRVVVGRSPVGDEPTASAAFPPAEHDSQILGQLSRVLETAPEDTSPCELLQQVSALVESTGREGWDQGATTLIERGTLLSDLLAQRDRRLGDTDQHRHDRPDLGDSGITR
ncbi:hypothetical protein I6I57_13730 [Brevibacterium casei]|uniref:DUF222 domain-containing protein n=1 Tax=Brevibacterium ammoniilyticum TaxID=1046555 RepID=A0ABP9U3L8_9MICO|nr:hypothetical protein [Brevibacterium casei]QQT68754.1 hypothetical protein I6I57_13730 [Brevibacterium casei]